MFVLTKNIYVPYEKDDTEVICVSADKDSLKVKAREVAGDKFKDEKWQQEDNEYLVLHNTFDSITYSIDEVEVV